MIIGTKASFAFLEMELCFSRMPWMFSSCSTLDLCLPATSLSAHLIAEWIDDALSSRCFSSI